MCHNAKINFYLPAFLSPGSISLDKNLPLCSSRAIKGNRVAQKNGIFRRRDMEKLKYYFIVYNKLLKWDHEFCCCNGDNKGCKMTWNTVRLNVFFCLFKMELFIVVNYVCNINVTSLHWNDSIQQNKQINNWDQDFKIFIIFRKMVDMIFIALRCLNQFNT